MHNRLSTTARRLLHAAAATLTLGAAVATGGLAHAQDVDAKEAADAIYEEAKRLYDAGNFMRACPKFNAVHKIDPGVGSALYLGDCLEKEGKLASAMEAFSEAIALAKAKKDKRGKIAQVRFASVEALVGKLTIELPSDLPGNASVDLDERVLDPSEYGKPLPLNEGPHVVVLRAPGYLPNKVAKEVKDGSSITLQLPALLPDPDAAWQISPLQVTGIVVGGVGIAGLVVGGVFGAQAISSSDEYQTHCNGLDSNLCRASGTELFEAAEDEATISTATFIVGGVLLAAGVTLVIVGDKPSVNESTTETALAVRLSLGGVTLGGTF